MIDREEIRTELEERFLAFFPEKKDIEWLEDKIETSIKVIKDLDIMISHAYGLHQVLLEWNREHYKEIKVRAEISLEILTKKYDKFN